MSQAPQDWFRAHSAEHPGLLHFSEPLSRHSYYRIGGPADILASPKSLEELEFLSEGIRQTGTPFVILGAGSNLLASDAGYRGLVIRSNRVNQRLDVSGDPSCLTLHTGASVAVSTLLRHCAREGWGGLEFLTGVPGLVGGAVFMNAGTHLGEAASRLIEVDYFQLPLTPDQQSPLRVSGAELKYEYRRNHFLPAGALVWEASWRVIPDEPAKVKARIDETLLRRKSTQPLDYPSCGSVFKNPKSAGIHAWQVVDQLGLRGHRIGDAQISEKHSNFIVNLGMAKAADVRALIELIQTRARKELGIDLEPEVILLG